MKNYPTFEEMDDARAHEIMNEARDGVTHYHYSTVVQSTPFTSEEWSVYLNMSERTLQRYNKDKKKFDMMQSERILQISHLFDFGTDVFGERAKFSRWLETRNLSLGNIIPKTLLDSTFGIAIIRDELGRIAHGVLA